MSTQQGSARDLAAALLLEVDKKKAYARDLLPGARGQLEDARDRGLVTEIAYGVIRRRGTLDALLRPRSKRPLDRLARPVRVALRMGLYQVIFLDRIPVHAAVDHAVTWARRRTNEKTAGFVNAVLRATVRKIDGLARGEPNPRRDVPREDGSAMRIAENVFADPEGELASNLSDRYSMPSWMVERWLEARGERTTLALLRTAIGRPPLGMRARVERGELYKVLEEEGLHLRPGPVDTALLVDRGNESAALAAVGRGDAWVQDATSQLVAPLVAPEAGERILDLCAAPGGKTLHLADLMQRGMIVACDVEDAKLEKLRAVCDVAPAGVEIELRRIEREGGLPFEPGSFDRILIDAPCTNTGVLRRRVEVRWRLSPEDIGSLARVQGDLLERALPLLKPGGRLVYTTCSLEPEENQGVVEAFATAHPDLPPLRTQEILGGRDQDAGFAAILG